MWAKEAFKECTSLSFEPWKWQGFCLGPAYRNGSVFVAQKDTTVVDAKNPSNRREEGGGEENNIETGMEGEEGAWAGGRSKRAPPGALGSAGLCF